MPALATIGRSPLVLLGRWLPRFRRAYRNLETLAGRESWSRAELELLQLERLNRLWNSARQHVPYYRNLATQLRLPPSFSSLAEYQASIPLLSKEEMRRQGECLLSHEAERGRWERTSGSTGTPTRAFWGSRGRQETLHGKYRFYAQWNIDIFDRMAFIWGDQPPTDLSKWQQTWSRIERWLTDRLRNRRRMVPHQITDRELERHLTQIAAFRPGLIYSYTTILYLLAKRASDIQFRSPELRIVNYTAEPALPRMVRAMEEGFGVPAVSEYGSVECGFIAGEGPDRKLRVRDDMVLLETLPRGDGRYDIVVTPLTNPSFPLLRYQLGDVTDAPLLKPAHGLSVLANVAGRRNDLLVLGDGQYLAADGLEQVFDSYLFVRRYRVHQAQPGVCTAYLELHGPVPPSALSKLREELIRALPGQKLVIEVHEQLPPQLSGKHRWITSDVPSPLSLTGEEQQRLASVS